LLGLAAAALGPLADAALFCWLTTAGWSLQSSHIASFGVATALNYLLKVRSTIVAQGRTRDPKLHGRLIVVALMALFLRGGILSLTSLDWGWSAPASIMLTVIFGLAVTLPGNAYVLSPALGAARTRALAMGIIAYAFALRLVYLGSVELLPEEAYYWNYSRHLDLGYLDHPPMVAWLIRMGTAAFGQSAFGVRVGASCCAVITSIFTYRLTRNYFGESAARAAVVLAQTLPFFFLSGLLLTPDAPLTAAWAATVYFLERALVAGRARAWWGVGISLGLGMISKYSIGLLIPVTLAFMLRDAKSRIWWRRFEPYAAALLALAIFSPVIVWNAQHEWASFAFQTSRRLAEAPRFALHKLIASALILITPIGVLAIAAAFTGAKPEEGARRRRLFIGMTVLIPLAVFAIFSLRHEVKLDWTGAPWIAAVPLMAASMTQNAAVIGGLRTWIRAAWVPTLMALLLIYGAGLHYLALGLPGLGVSRHIELLPVGWRDLSREIDSDAERIRADTGALPLIVGMDRYAIASELAFYGAENAQAAVETSSAHLFGGIGLMYARWTPAQLQEGRTLLLVAWDRRDLTGNEVESRAERLGPIEDEVLRRNGAVVRHYYRRLAYNYRSTPRPRPAAP